jgi:flagellin-like protein
MAMKLWKSIKAISSIIAVVILIAITISGGLLVFTIMNSTLTGSNQKVQVNFESLSLYRSTGEPKVVFTATLKNTGNRPIKLLTLKVHNESDYTVPSVSVQNPLEPGRTVGVTLTPPQITAEWYVVGNAYSVTVRAEAVDGSGFSHATTVMGLGLTGAAEAGSVSTTFGETGDGTSGPGFSNFIIGSWFTLSKNGIAQSVSAHFVAVLSGGKYKCAIYKRSDNSFVAGTEELSGLSGPGWRTFNFSDPKPNLTAQDYWLVIWGSSTTPAPALYGYDGPTGKGGYQAVAYSNSWPSLFNPASYDWRFSIYCTLTTAP